MILPIAAWITRCETLAPLQVGCALRDGASRSSIDAQAPVMVSPRLALTGNLLTTICPLTWREQVALTHGAHEIVPRNR